MAKKIDLTVKPQNPTMMAASESPRPFYPSFYIDDKTLPLSGKNVGKTVEARVHLKLRSYSENQKDSKKPKCSYQFDILDIQFDEGEGKEDKDNGHITADANLDRKMKY